MYIIITLIACLAFIAGFIWGRRMKKLESTTVAHDYAFKALPRLIEMIEPTERAKIYVTKLINSLMLEGYFIDAKIVRNKLRKMNGEDVGMAVMDNVLDEFNKLKETAFTKFKQYIDEGKTASEAIVLVESEMNTVMDFIKAHKTELQKEFDASLFNNKVDPMLAIILTLMFSSCGFNNK